MVRAVFIVQGEGRGHLSQSVALKEYLEADGHAVVGVYVGSSSREKIPSYYSNIFKDSLKSFNSPGFLRTPNKKGIYVGRTILYNLLRGFIYLREVRMLRKEINRLKPDVVVNFYEGLGALAMRKLPAGIRRIGIGHHFYLHLKSYPCGGGKSIHRALLKAHTRLVMSSCDKVLALSYSKTEGSEKIKIVPPLVRKQFREAKIREADRYLVYLLNEGFVVDLFRLAGENPDLGFDVFSDLPPETPVPEGIRLFTPDDSEFFEKMKNCRAVLTTAGFDTAAEAACLGLPLAVVPVENHFEQLCNSVDVEANGIGIILKNFDLNNLEKMTKKDHPVYKNWVASAASHFLLHIAG